MHKTKRTNRYHLATTILSAALINLLIQISGCKAPDGAAIKKKVDTDAYKMIDQKWKDDFGTKANYRIDGSAASPNDISTGRYVPPGTILTLPEAVAIATDHNGIYQTEKEKLYVKALDLRLARHQFEPILFGSAEAEYLKSRESEAIEKRETLGVQKMFRTGAQIGASVTLSWIDILSGNARGGLSKVFTVAATQPLLRGSDPNIVLENLTQAERDLLYKVRSFNRFRKEFVVNTITRYYQVLEAYDKLENAQNNYKTLVDIGGNTEKLASAGRLPRFELDQAEQDKLIAWDKVLQAEKAYKQALDEFKLVLAIPAGSEIVLDYNELDMMRNIKMTMPGFSESEAVETALEHRLDLANAFDAVNDAERKILVALDATRPDLRLVADADLKSKNASDPFNLRRRPRDTATLGVEFDPALDKYEAENAYALALVVLDQNRRHYEEKIDKVELDIRKVYRDLYEAAQRYKDQTEQVTLAKKRFGNTLLLLRNGRRRVNTRDVLDAQQDLYKAQDAASEALVNYTVSMLRFYRDVEIMQVRPDGMWQI